MDTILTNTNFASGFIHRCDTNGKIIFWDIDGVLAPFRFNGHVALPRSSKNGLLDIKNGMYFDREPSQFMQHVVRTCGARKQIIMGHVLNQKETDDKECWIKRYFPEITEHIWRPVEVSKADTILSYCKKYDIDLCDILFVDDTHAILWEAEEKGIPSWHPSSFLDWDYRS